jgi:hypothetical protein
MISNRFAGGRPHLSQTARLYKQTITQNRGNLS